MNVLIDPYMFELSEVQEIENNISFFLKLIQFCRKQSPERGFQILLYKGLMDRMYRRALQPFPIDIHVVQDDDLRDTIMQINSLFNNTLIKYVESVDIDECGGEQDFVVKDENTILDDDNYYEMFCTLLIPCYSDQVHIEEKILTGIKKNGKQIGDSIRLECICTQKEYTKECVFADIDELIPEREKVIDALKKKKENGEIPIADEVVAEIGDHHNHVQSNGKSFKSLKELSLKNKRILKLLQELGLSKVIFGRFTSQGVKAAGTMNIHHVVKTEQNDIVIVKFNSETGFQLLTDLYFPKTIGKLLFKYFETRQMTYQTVEELLEQL